MGDNREEDTTQNPSIDGQQFATSDLYQCQGILFIFEIGCRISCRFYFWNLHKDLLYISADCIFRFCNSASKKGKLKSNSIHKYPCDGSHLLACRKKNMNRKKRKSKNKSMKFRAISRWILKLYANLSIYKLNKCSSNYEELQKWKKCVYHVR